MRADSKIALSCLLLVFLVFIGCRKPQNEKPLFSLQETTGIDFTNTIKNSPDFNIFSLVFILVV